MDIVFLPAIAALLCVLALVPLARKLAIRAGFVDEPGGRKHHEEPVPPIGGLVLFPAFMLAALLTGADLREYWPLFTGILLLLLTGALDDYRHLPPWPKFTVQFVAAFLIVIAGDARLYHLGALFGFGEAGLGFISLPFSVIATVLLINAVNLMDGLDGLAGGLGLMIMLFLGAAAAMTGHSATLAAIAPLAGALAGFLFYNMRSPVRSRAVIFMGDAGSMALGLCIAWFSMKLAQGTPPALEPIAVAWILALPIMDTCAQFYRRMKNGLHPFSPDRGHFHYHFIDAGIAPGKATACVLLIVFVLAMIGYGGTLAGVPSWILTGAWVSLLFVHIMLSYQPETYTNALKKFARP